MPTAIWDDGAGDGDWSDAGNWTGGSGAGGAPANGDTIVIATSSRDIVAGLTTGLTGCTLKIGRGYTGSIGSLALGYLDIDGPLVEIDKLAGEIWLTGTQDTINVLNLSGTADSLHLRGNASTDVGTLRAVGGVGTITVGGNAVLDNLIVLGAPSISVIVEANVTSLDTITQDSGKITCSASIAGLAELRGGETIIAGTATVATLQVEPKGMVRYTSSGTITTLNAYGTFDGRQNGNAAVTITDPYVFEGHRVFLGNGITAWNLPSGITYLGFGTIHFPLGSTVSF